MRKFRKLAGSNAQRPLGFAVSGVVMIVFGAALFARDAAVWENSYGDPVSSLLIIFLGVVLLFAAGMEWRTRRSRKKRRRRQ